MTHLTSRLSIAHLPLSNQTFLFLISRSPYYERRITTGLRHPVIQFSVDLLLI